MGTPTRWVVQLVRGLPASDVDVQWSAEGPADVVLESATDAANVRSVHATFPRTGTYRLTATAIDPIQDLPDGSGRVVSSSFVQSDLVLVVLDGSPGTIVNAATVSPRTVELVGSVGNGPRRVVAGREIAVVTNYGSDDLSVAVLENGAARVLETRIPVGDGPLGLDVRDRSGGGSDVISVGSLDDTITVTSISADGSLLDTRTESLPFGARGPYDVLWLGDGHGSYAVSCESSDELIIGRWQ